MKLRYDVLEKHNRDYNRTGARIPEIMATSKLSINLLEKVVFINVKILPANRKRVLSDRRRNK